MKNGRAAGRRERRRRNIILFFFLSPTYSSFLFYSSLNGLTTNLEPLKLAVEGQEEGKGKYRQSEFSSDEWEKRGSEKEITREREGTHDSRKL